MLNKFASHIEQWRHNRRFLSEIPFNYPDWIVTAAFYTALHAVDTLLTKNGLTVNGHNGRNDILMRTHHYQQIWRNYKQLYDTSRTVRYLATPQKWVPAKDIMREVVQGLLYPIENSVKKLIDDPGLELPPINLRTE